MLYLFCKNPRQVLTHQRLLERLRDVDEKFVDAHLDHLYQPHPGKD